MTHPPVGIGILGAGFLAETRARCYAQVAGERACLVAVASQRRERAEDFARRHGVLAVMEDAEALCQRADVDVVDLCVPNLWHRPLAELAARAGKHVICTKPMTAYVGQDLPADATDSDIADQNRRTMWKVAVADARAMVNTARESEVQLLYGENWIFAPPVVRARRLLRASGGSILTMQGGEAHMGSHSPYAKVWRHTGGGALIRLAAHPVGAMLHLKREEGRARSGRPIRPVSVLADVADLTQNPALGPHNTKVATGWQDVENWGSVILAFEDGSRAVAHGSDNLLGGMRSHLSIDASNCHLECNLSPHDLLRAYAPDEQTFADEYLMEKLDSRAGWSTPLPDEDWSSGQLPMLQAFIQAIAEKRTLDCDGALGAEVTSVLYAAYVSASEGRRVSLDELPD